MGNLETLEAAGIAVENLSTEQKAVFESLSSEEVTLLTDINSRVEAASGDVEAHTNVIGGVLF